METRKAKTFLLNHTFMYELISMENGKYLMWKLHFPRVGDTLITVDKALDFGSWEKLYSILKRITLQCAVTSPISSPTTLPVECCQFWYKMDIQKIPLDIGRVREFFDIDTALLHDEVLCANVLLIDAYAEDSTAAGRSSTSSAPTANTSSRKRTFSVSQQSQTDNCRETEGQIIKSSDPIRIPAAACATDDSMQGSTESHSSENFCLSYSADEDDDVDESLNDSEDENSRPSGSDGAPSNNESHNESYEESHDESFRSKDTNIEKSKIKMDLQTLSEILREPQYLNRFCFEKDGPNDAGNRTFNIYSVDNKISYAAFHSPNVLKKMRDRTDCRLFFHYSEEMLHRFRGLTEMQFEGINHILMVYVNHFLDRVRPFGYILLPDKSPAIIDNVVSAIDEWLNADGSLTTVTKCVTQQDDVLGRSIANTWSEAKVIRCSEEYRKDIKFFAKKNKGLSPQHIKLTRLACVLCHLPEIHIAKGIEMIERNGATEYGKSLVQYLKTKWTGRSISIYGEDIVYRTVNVCKRFSIQFLRKEFSDNSFRKSRVLKNCWDFIDFLNISSKINSVEMLLDGTKFGRKRKSIFELNTKRQKERERGISNIRQNLEMNLKTMSQDEAIEQFLQQMASHV